MNIEEYYEFCSSLPGAREDFPFDEETLCFKVMGKLFCLTNVDKFEGINLKCDPVKAVQYRAEFEEIEPGYHMNKKHWNTIDPRGSLDDSFIREMIQDSYDLVVRGLSKKQKEELNSY